MDIRKVNVLFCNVSVLLVCSLEVHAVVFCNRAACPRNNIRRNGTFLSVEMLELSSLKWKSVYTDNDWSTKFHWTRPWTLSPQSTATIVWTIPLDTLSGTYRIRYFGDYKHLLGHIIPFEGVSGSFTVTGQPST